MSLGSARWLGGMVLFASVGAEARVPASDRYASPTATACSVLQEAADRLVSAINFSAAHQIGQLGPLLLELALVSSAWGTTCASTYGSILRDAPAPGFPALQDLDADLLFDEDELVYGLDPNAADSDRDGLDDAVDPGWLADLLEREGEARLAATAEVAEEAVHAGDLAGAAGLLAEVQGALGCDAEPVGESCRAAEGLEVRLGGR